MDIFNVISLLGGLAMFLYGMRLMGDSLKENSSGTLKRVMGKVTDNAFKGFLLGLAVTALIQSSTATIVITAGLVSAGILTLRQSLGILVGANLGTTVTGQIIRLMDIEASGTSFLRFLQPSTLAPIALIIGILLIMGSLFKKARSVGNIAIGFGILFSGLLNMTEAVKALKDSGVFDQLFASLGDNPFLGYLTGAGVAFVLQSSSAAVGILQTFSKSGMLAFKSIYAVIVGIYLGDCVTTAIVCWIGAKAEARRVGIVNILYNLGKSILVLAAVTVAHQLGSLNSLLDETADMGMIADTNSVFKQAAVTIAHLLGSLNNLWDKTADMGMIADTNTVFNLCSALALLPMMRVFEKLSIRIVREKPAPESRFKTVTDALNPVFYDTPALAFQSCYNLLLSVFAASRANIEKSFRLLQKYDPALHKEILADEIEIDRMSDRVNDYMVGFLSHLQNQSHVSIIDQYYRVTSEFERLGDHGVNIAEHAATLHKNNTILSAAALSELAVLESAIINVLDESDQTFRKRDEDAAGRIEPLVQVIKELTAVLKKNHLKRMSTGECNVYANATYTDLLIEFQRIGDVCSNVGVATIIRVHPELADHEHVYFDRLHAGGDESFDTAYERNRQRYFALLPGGTK